MQFLDKHFGKLFLIAVLVVATIVTVKWFAPAKDQLGRSNFSSYDTLAGSEANFVSLPRSASFSNSTTTDATNTFAAGAQVGFLDGGNTITQYFNTDGYDWVHLGIAAKAGTATSTLYARLQLYDGTDWADVHASTTPGVVMINNTSTLPLILEPTGFQWDPGTASTTLWRFPFYVYGSKQARLIMYADDLLSDSADGVQVWAKVIKIDPFQR